MLIGEIISVALGALRANKLRSLLTMLGIVIGVAAVIAMVAIGSGAQQAGKDRINALGTTLLAVNPGQQRQAGVARSGAQSELSLDASQAAWGNGGILLAAAPAASSGKQQVASADQQ